MEWRSSGKQGLWLVCAAMVAAFAWSCGDGGAPAPGDMASMTAAAATTEICPNPESGDAALKTVLASGGRVRYSEPPEVFAEAHGRSVSLSHGESEWCAIVSDVFHVVTSDTPLVVAPGEEITVPNPLPREHLYNAGISMQAATADPTPQAGSLIWPFGPGGGRGHGLDWDDDRVVFTADDTPGRYVVSLWLNFARRADIFSSSNRSAYYALLIEVQD